MAHSLVDMACQRDEADRLKIEEREKDLVALREQVLARERGDHQDD